MKNYSKQSCSTPVSFNVANYSTKPGKGRCTNVKSVTLKCFMRQIIGQLDTMGRLRTKDIYHSALNSFLRFSNDVCIDGIDSEMMLRYENYLHVSRGVKRNTSSFYIRVLRAVYNRAVDRGLTVDNHPFRAVYTGIDKTVKRALPLNAVKRIMRLDLSARPGVALARDLFMFSFYTRGMSFVDMAYLKKSDLCDGVLTYRRRKTGQLLQIKWEKCMQEIIDRHGCGIDGYLLPIISRAGVDERRQYESAMCITNIRLKEVGRLAGIPAPLTTYVARHSWASIARQKNIPLSIISEGMGHESEKTTRIYLASLETSVVDKANSAVIKALFG